MKAIHPIRVACLLLLTAAVPLGCVNTDTAIIRSSRPAMSAYNRTTEPDENQVLELIAAEQASDQGNYEQAIRLFEDLLSQNPTMTDAYLGLGALYQESREDGWILMLDEDNRFVLRLEKAYWVLVDDPT